MRSKLVICCGFLLWLGCAKGGGRPVSPQIVSGPVAVLKTNPAKVYAHYMPWFENSANGQWGMHWTMATVDPDAVDADGKRQIAAHFYPLIGPYSSSDPDLIEYHLLLMKLAGIDGV
ncbi:MAG TPA: endo-alpha-mannosidase, partial [Candidatus Latescibacteria bacterium]|nr:endo-alpha-mannosidase [Candidatus Latescibacterota bacterium]